MTQKEYKELLSLTRQYLTLEFQNKEYSEQKNQQWIVSELETYNYFKEYAIRIKNLEIKKPLEIREEIKPKQVDEYVKAMQAAPLKQQIIPREPVVQIIDTAIIEAATPLQDASEALIVEVKKRAFELEPVKAIVQSDLTDIKKMVQELFPHQTILDHLPQNIVQIIIISDHSEKQNLIFLSNYSKAIDLLLAPSKIMTLKMFESSPFNRDLKMIIQTGNDLTNRPDGVTILQVLDLPKYFKEPALKAELWELTTSKFLNG